VVSQEVHFVLGDGPVGKLLFYIVQFATMLILYTGGNTSFNGFPFLASFVAEDAYLPKQLTRRGHRLAFSNGIIVLTVVAVALLLATGAKVSSLVALYAIGVFTGFAMAGAGMVKHHLDNREAHWRRGVVVNGFSAFLTALIVLIFATVKFTEGAWVVVIVGPLMYFGSSGSTASTSTRRASWRRARPRPPKHPCSPVTWSSSWSTSSTWRRPAPCSTRGPSIPTSCGPSTSCSTPRSRPRSRPNGGVSA